MHRTLLTTALALLALLMVGGPAPGAAATVSLRFESQMLDLETGAVVERAPGPSSNEEGDVYLAYNADRTPHAVVVPLGDGAEIAFMEGAGFDTVTAADLADLRFSSVPPDRSLTAADTVVLRTAAGALFKLGNLVETDDSATFDHERLQ